MYIQNERLIAIYDKIHLGGYPPKPPLKIRSSDLRKGKKGKKDKTLVIRLTNSEYKRIKKLAELEGLTVSELIRKSVFINEKTSKLNLFQRLLKKSETLKEFVRELNRIGVNLNQIARYCNSIKDVDEKVLNVLLAYFDELRSIKKLLEVHLQSGSKDDNKSSNLQK